MTLSAFLARPTRAAARSMSPAERARILRALERRIGASRGRLATLGAQVEGRRG